MITARRYLKDHVAPVPRRQGLSVTPAFEGGVVSEYIMRWDAMPDGRTSKASGPMPADGHD